MARYRSRHLEIDAEEFTGTNGDVLRAIIPPGAGSLEDVWREPVLILRTPGRRPRLVHEGDQLSSDGISVTVHSGDAFSRFWEPAEGPLMDGHALGEELAAQAQACSPRLAGEG